MSETVLITGAGIGIGRATAKAFASAGHTVIVTDILEKEGRAVVAEIAGAGGTAEFHKLDVRSTADADALVADLMQGLAQVFSAERRHLEAQWSRGGQASTEDLRVSLQRYRSFFERLLSV